MADNPLPEMTRLSLSDLALRVKTMKVTLGSSIEDALTRALDPPSSINIQRAVSALVEVCVILLNFTVPSLSGLRIGEGIDNLRRDNATRKAA
jgi:ATP-dependent RNA helicase DHX29